MIPRLVTPTGTKPTRKQSGKSSLLGRLKEEHANQIEDDKGTTTLKSVQPLKVDIVRSRSKAKLTAYQNDALMENPSED